jgi:hypothetical protein
VHGARGVGLGDRFARLQDPVDGLLGGKRPALLEQRAEVAAFEQLHHEVGRSALQPAHVDHPADVLAIEPGGGAGFEDQPLHGGLVSRQLAAHELERDAALELDVPADTTRPMPPMPSRLSTRYLPAIS